MHGFADYFFQTPVADFWVDRGYDFYALDFRKYGLSLRDHQTPNFVTDLAQYYPEIDEAYRRIVERDGHRDVLVSAHSTGAGELTCTLKVDGELVKSATSSGGSATVDCGDSFGF